MEKLKRIIHELKHHVPFTIIATFVVVLFVFFTKEINYSPLFFVIHPLHVLASAIVSSAIFFKYKKNWIQALIVGVVSSISLGSLSDIIFPYLGGVIFNFETVFHFSLIEEPFEIIGMSVLGGIIGIYTKWTKFPHFVHVTLSVFGSLLYLIAFSSISTIFHFAIAFLIVFLAVLIPCCISDIVIPLLFLKNGKK